MKPSTKAVTHNNKNNNTVKDVTITTINDHNKIPRVEKVVFDNRIKRKNVLALNEKVAAIREYEKRPVYKRIGRMFQCSPDQIKRIVQQKDVILNAWEQRTRKCRDARTLEMKVVKVSMLGKAVYEWIRRMMYYKDILITDGLIQKMALQFKSAMGLQNFFPHQEWCDKFRSTYNIYTCDSKMLTVGYVQGHSVQIKDVMKDVLSECSPDPDDADNEQLVDDDLDDVDNGGDDDDEAENGLTNGENDCISINSDDEEVQVRTKLKKKLTDKVAVQKNDKPKTLQMLQSSQLQGLRQLVTLQANGLSGMSQKVLVATPIVQPGQKQGSAPMTMTIIPLATLGQPPTNSINSCPAATARPNINKDQQVVVPPPIIEIKKEIKEEPKDQDQPLEKMEEEETVLIKKEYLTDDEGDESGAQPKQITSTHPGTSAHIVAIPLTNKEMLEDSTNDSLDDLTLSSLRKRIKTEESSNEEDTTKRSSPPPLSAITASTATTLPSKQMPPMPPLTKAPTLSHAASASTAATSSSNQPAAPSSRATAQKRQKSEDEGSQRQPLPAIQSCLEARKYLKLLEDFALERENFRLIGLITRADEVLRELDRKDNNEDEDVDVD